MELSNLELQIVNELKQVVSLNNKEIAKRLNKDAGNISRKMKQLVEKQVVSKKRQSVGKRTFNYYSLIKKDNIDLQQVVEIDTSCKNEKSILSKELYDPSNINVRETPLSRQIGVSKYHTPIDNLKQTISSRTDSEITNNFLGNKYLTPQNLVANVLKVLNKQNESKRLTPEQKRLINILTNPHGNYAFARSNIILFIDYCLSNKLIIRGA